MSEGDVMIGLETHVQLDTETKLLCGCPNEDAEEPNTHVCPTCLGHPGSKPRLNEAVLRQAVMTASALQCDINEEIFFSRKTYFYPDMSKNFQITQYEIPVGENGEYEVKVGDREKTIGITRLHIEEDPAKLKHSEGSGGSSGHTLVDYNRAGTPLLEIVTEPDFESPEEAREYLQQLAQMLKYLEVYFPESSFSIKSDANISIEGGAKVEVKNITGTSEVEKALSYEISRQRQMKRRGKEVTQQTRGFNPGMGVTEKQREKETEEDYGYIFEPDLTRQELGELSGKVKDELPELPHEKFDRFRQQYGLKDKLVESLVTEQELADDFERLAEEHEPGLVASLLTGDLKKVLNYHELKYSDSGLELEWIEYLVQLLEDDSISDRNAEKVLREIVEELRRPEEVVEEQDLLKAEESEVDSIISEVIDENEEAVGDYNSGEEEALNFLVGQVMERSQGKADPKTARQKLKQQLD